MESKLEMEVFERYLRGKLLPNWRLVTYELQNKSSHDINLIIEPYVYSVIKSPGAKFQVMADEPPEDGIALHFSDNYIQIWASRMIELFDSGVGLGVTMWEDTKS